MPHIQAKRDILDDIASVFGFGSQQNSKVENSNGNNGKGNSGKSDPAPAPDPVHDTPGSAANPNQGGDPVTVVKTKVLTIQPTFDGDIVWKTSTLKNGEDVATPEPTAEPEPDTQTRDSPNSDLSGLPEEISNPSLETVAPTLPVDTNVVKAVPSLTAAGGSSLVSETAVGSSQGSGGSSGAAKAGIAIGVLAAVLIVAGAIYFLFARRKKDQQHQSLEDDEKLHGPFSNIAEEHHAAPPPPAKAPRLSLRPVTQFLPNLAMGEKRASKLNTGTGLPGGTYSTVGLMANQQDRSGSAWERPLTSQSTHPANPFGNSAERIQTPIQEEPRPVSPLEGDQAPRRPVSPIVTETPNALEKLPATSGPVLADTPSTLVPGLDTRMTKDASPAAAASSESSAFNSTVVATSVVAAATVGTVTARSLKRQASRNHGDGPKPLDLTVQPPAPLSIIPPSPAGTEFSVNSVSPGQPVPPSSSAAAIAAAGGPAQSTVHRVQLDFKPTLEDEMELRCGELVRLLHEYDDGWALCIRLDRSQQGVVPRTCLSTRPVKPRPGPRPPVNPQRPMTPQGRPISPQSYPRPQSPASHPGTSYTKRPASPAHGRPCGRSQSPGPRYQVLPNRAQSPSGMGKKNSPPGPSRMKPEGTRRASPTESSRQTPEGSPTPVSPIQQTQTTSLPSANPPTGPISRKPVPGQAY